MEKREKTRYRREKKINTNFKMARQIKKKIKKNKDVVETKRK